VIKIFLKQGKIAFEKRMAALGSSLSL